MPTPIRWSVSHWNKSSPYPYYRFYLTSLAVNRSHLQRCNSCCILRWSWVRPQDSTSHYPVHVLYYTRACLLLFVDPSQGEAIQLHIRREKDIRVEPGILPHHASCMEQSSRGPRGWRTIYQPTVTTRLTKKTKQPLYLKLIVCTTLMSMHMITPTTLSFHLHHTQASFNFNQIINNCFHFLFICLIKLKSVY